jgi:hypothetical protein
MAATRDDFEYWLCEMDNQLNLLLNNLPPNLSAQLDYSVGSLLILEEWLLANFAMLNDLLAESRKGQLDQISRYVGETFRKNVGGIWNINLKDKKDAYYRIPVVEKKGKWTECPVSLVTASADRRRGNYIASVLNSYVVRYGTV